MQDDTNTVKTGMDDVAHDLSNQGQPSFGLGVNPSSSPDPAQPTVTPAFPQLTTTPPATDSPTETPTSAPAPPTITTTHADITNGNGSDDLLEMKKQALSQLSPLVDKLEQPAEERFKTLMMMVQASDDQSLLKQAYEVAQKIEDEKVRAEALLNVINEINYFTSQQHHSA
jgi:hypothetical protein